MSKDEYKELCANFRLYARLQFAELTVFLAITAVLLNFIFTTELSENLKLIFKIVGSSISLLFLIINFSIIYMWTHFIKRAAKLEESLGYKQFSTLPGSLKFNIKRPGAIAVLVFHFLVLLFWLFLIFWKECLIK